MSNKSQKVLLLIKKLTNNPKSSLQFPKRTELNISTLWSLFSLFSLGGTNIQPVHCLSNRKHLSTLSNTFNVLFFFLSLFLPNPSLMAPQDRNGFTLALFFVFIVLLPQSGNQNSSSFLSLFIT